MPCYVINTLHVFVRQSNMYIGHKGILYNNTVYYKTGWDVVGNSSSGHVYLAFLLNCLYIDLKKTQAIYTCNRNCVLK